MSSYDAFAPIYDEWSADMTADVAWYAELAREADGPVAELAVGNGRVAVPVAQAIGRTVVGIDRSPAMLAGARERAAAAGVELDLREGDMRDLGLDEPAGLIYCPFRSLLHRGIGHTVHQFPHESRLDIVLDSGGQVSLWWATKAEWEGLIDVAGVEVEALYSGFEREPFGESSGEFVWVVRKPGP